MIFNDFDIWEQAIKDMKMNESVSFVSRGRLITEASLVEMFNKINALLNADGMECSHKWLYSLDPTELSESEATRVNNLYKLGCDRGMIECGETDDEKEANEDEVAVAVEPVPKAPAPTSTPAVPQTAYTILYSAMRNGEIKTGEAYSNSINPRSAKADVIGLLERAGYTNVKVLAIECGDPDECGNDCCNTYCKQADMTPVAPQDDAIPDYSIDNESVAGAIGGAIKGAVGGAAAGAIFDSDELTEDEAKTEIKKAFDTANKEVQDDKVEQKAVKQFLETNKNKIDDLKKKFKDQNVQDALDKIVSTLDDYANGKIKDSMDEAKKPSTGICAVIRGLIKILFTLLSLSGSGIGLVGKVVVWAGKLITAGADKINMQLKDSEDETLKEADDKDDSKDDKSDDTEDKEDDKASKDEDNKDSAKEDTDVKDDKKEDKKEDAEEPDEKLKDDSDEKADKASDKDKEDKELEASEKAALKDSYKKAFKAAMLKCKFFDKSFDDLSLDEKVEFFTLLSKAWTKVDPSKFMSDKEIQQLQSIVVKK